MRASLADSLAVVLPNLPASLVTPHIAGRLRSRAAALVTTARTGFECRLGDAQEQVDLQQGISQVEALSPLLRALIDALRPDAGNAAIAAWESLERFATAWAIPSSQLHAGIVQLWLEYDVTAVAGPARLPSLFTVFAPQSTSMVDETRLEQLVLATLSGGDPVFPVSLDRCRAALPEGTRISHVGLMLGRDHPAVRVHISRLPIASYGSFLRQVGWPGDPVPLQHLARALNARCDHIILCADAADEVGPTLGLECFFTEGDGIDPRWPAFLDWLVEHGMCTSAKRAGLLQWVGITQPAPDTGWPDNWIVESLLQPVTHFGVFGRRLSHVKVSFESGCVHGAKAYFGFVHSWLTRR